MMPAAERGASLSHPGRKDKNAARVGHPPIRATDTQQARSGLHRECGNANKSRIDAGLKGIHRPGFRKENPGMQSAAGLLT
jgi:hypothetical protein